MFNSPATRAQAITLYGIPNCVSLSRYAALGPLSLSRAHITNHAARLALFRWDVSLVTNFDHLFMESNSANFNEPIGNWTTSASHRHDGLLRRVVRVQPGH